MTKYVVTFCEIYDEIRDTTTRELVKVITEDEYEKFDEYGYEIYEILEDGTLELVKKANESGKPVSLVVGYITKDFQGEKSNIIYRNDDLDGYSPEEIVKTKEFEDCVKNYLPIVDKEKDFTTYQESFSEYGPYITAEDINYKLNADEKVYFVALAVGNKLIYEIEEYTKDYFIFE